uniref:Vitellogenin-receptor n=1 Tax=Aleuroglyphus ovatus TaxID=212130 RepID=A0A899IIS3_ALEOV|nr:vitellogenin-receptor [Aleuroglyphus ovatus]
MGCKLKPALLFICCLAALQTAHLVKSECSDSFFDCKNGKCIAHFFQCDDDNDCGNFQDEINCFGNASSSIFSNDFWHQDCPREHFACNDDFHTCVPNRWLCDGMKECSNGADEANCTTATVDCHDDFKCANGQCVPSIWRCDGIFDCDDNSDELNCTSFKKTELCDKEHGLYQCSTGECIPFTKVCDKHNDCLLGDDESTQCHVNPCHEKKCSHLCMFNPETNASVCYCPAGYRLVNNTSCLDYNECDDNKLTNVCSQKCINLEGHFKCDCFDDYEMVNSTCLAKGPSPVLYYSTGIDIRAYNLRNQTLYPVVQAQALSEIIVGMDMLAAKQKLFFFGSTPHSHGSVYEVAIEGNADEVKNSRVQLLYHEDLKGIEGLSVDWLAGHYYITESELHRIVVCNLDSVLCTTPLSNLSQPRGILTLPTKGKLFWTQWGSGVSGIFQSDMDGSNPSILVDKVEWPNDLAMDEEMNRIYWCDGREGSIEFYDFDTSIRHLVFKDHNRQPYSLFVFEDSLYWSDWATQQIEACNKISCHHIKTIVRDPMNRMFGLTVYHPIMHKSSATLRPYNPCGLSTCSHMCLLKKGALTYSCRCPDHMILGPDNRTCTSRTDEPFLLVSTGYKVFKYYLNTISSSYTEELKILPIYSIAEIAFNYERNELYIHDGYKNRIGVLDLNKKQHLQWKTLAFGGLNGVMGLVYDVNTDNVYWVDMIKGTLEAASSKGLGRATLNDQLSKPVSLAINAPVRKMYIGLRSTPAEIISVDMDGKSKQTLIMSSAGLPLALALENHNRLLFGDPVLQKIEFFNIADNQKPLSEPHRLISKMVDTINSIAIANDTVYWTNIDSPAFFYSSMETSNLTGQKERVVHKRRLSERNVNLDLLKVVIGAKQTPIYDFCLPRRHKCAHLCLISAVGPTCKCADNYASPDGGVTCNKVPTMTKPSFIPIIFNPSDIYHILGEVWNNHSDAMNDDVWFTVGNNNSSETTTQSAVRPSTAVPGTADDQRQVASSGFSFRTFFKIIFYIILIGLAIFAYFLWKDPSLRDRVIILVDNVRPTEGKNVRFVKNLNFDQESVTTFEASKSQPAEEPKKLETLGDNNNPFQ